MIVVVVLVLGILIGRLVGVAGLRSLNSWRSAIRVGLSAMLLVTASAHFTGLRHDLFRMIPDVIPFKMEFVYFTGVCEILAAIGLHISRVRRITGVALIILFIAILPANIHAANIGATLGGEPVTPLVIRIPLQMIFIALTWWSAVARQ